MGLFGISLLLIRMKNSSTAFGAALALLMCVLGCWKSPSRESGYDRTPAAYPTPSSNGNGEKAINNSNTNKMDEKAKFGFSANLPSGFAMPADDVGRKLLREYGAMFVAKGVTAPTVVVFRDETEVSSFQGKLPRATETIGGFGIELQAAAMADLRNALNEARSSGSSISPRAADSAKRTYNETVGLWMSRVEPALKHWVGKGRITQAEANRIGSLSPFEQVSEVLKLEEQGIYFAKDLSKSIIYSVAPPGTSQHLSLLAFDVKEHDNPQVRALLAKHKWYQTVVSDLPHFTYLGVSESELPGLGLKKVVDGGRTFWVPDI